MTDPAAPILLVDDREDNLVALKAILGDLGHELVGVQSGREALRRLLQRDFALILLDVDMPSMDGFETAALIRSRTRCEHTPIIFITAHGDDTHVAHGYSLGAVDYILTPVVPEILRAKVAVFVELFEKTAEVRRQAASLVQRAMQLHQLTEAALALSRAASVDEVLRLVVAQARRIVGAAYATAEVVAEDHRASRAAAGEWPDGSEPAACVAPLTARDGRTVGAIRLSGKREGAFTPEDDAVAVQLAQMASTAVQNIVFAEEREANRLKDEFLATVSHELRTPLSSILTWAHLLRDQRLDGPNMTRGLEIIARSARAQAQLIDDLLDMSRIVSGKMRIETAALDLRSVIMPAVDSLRPAAAAKRIDVACSVSEVPLPVRGDATRLQQVLLNLLSNAIKFTPTGGRIEVRAQAAGDQAEITVSDTGKGIAAAFLPHVFDRFRQADSSSTRAHGGLGLGLAIARHLIELHGGQVNAASAGDGRGATFSVRLPTTPSAAEAATQNGRRPLQSPLLGTATPLCGVRVLLVEDDRFTCEAIVMTLEDAGAEVRAAGSSAEAMAVLAEWQPTLLLSDIGLPGEDGCALLRRVHAFARAADVSIPAIALTAYAQAQDVRRTLAAGYVAHLTKPVESDRLIDAVARVARQATAEGNGAPAPAGAPDSPAAATPAGAAR